LRRLEGIAGVDRRDLAPGPRSALRGPPGARQPQVRLPRPLGHDLEGTAGRLHRADRRGRRTAVHRVQGRMGEQYPMIVRTWEQAWEQFTPFLAFPPEIRRVIYTTNLIESMNARFRRAV